MAMTRPRTPAAFTLLELIIVVVIIGIIAAIAVPRMSRGSAGASDKALAGNLAVIRNAIDMYAGEHVGTFPTSDEVAEQLTGYTDVNGDVADMPDATHVYGPYLHKVPPLPVGANKGGNGIADADGDGVGWIYAPATGAIRANCPADEEDIGGTAYRDY